MPGGEFECYFVDGVIQNGPEVPLFNCKFLSFTIFMSTVPLFKH